MPRTYECPLERVQEDIRDHGMSIVRDDEHGRHLRFRSTTRGSAYWFDILTWPGSLMIDGDCGTYVFRRVPDMFDFFRNDADREITINPGYWAQKVQAMCKQGKIKEFSHKVFAEAVKADFDDTWEGREPKYEETAEEFAARRAVAWAAVTAEMPRDYDGAHEAIEFIRNFECEDFRFVDWERSIEDFTFHYLWNCWAIVLAIGKYDALKAAGREAANDDGSEKVAA